MGKFGPRQLIKIPGRMSYHDMILADEPVSYWNFGAGAGSKAWEQIGINHGDITGATWTPQANGRNVLDFDGVNDYVSGNFGNVITDEGTVEAWVNPTSYPTSANENLICTLGLLVLRLSILEGVTDRTWFAIYNEGGVGVKIAVSINNVPLGQEIYIAVTFNPSSIIVYLNGIVNNTGNPLVGNLASQSEFRIGRSTDNTFPWRGLINEVAIYNVALSPETILRHYQVGVLGGLTT